MLLWFRASTPICTACHTLARQGLQSTPCPRSPASPRMVAIWARPPGRFMNPDSRRFEGNGSLRRRERVWSGDLGAVRWESVTGRLFRGARPGSYVPVNEKPDLFGACNRVFDPGPGKGYRGRSELFHGEVWNVMADLLWVVCHVMVRKDSTCCLFSKEGAECPRFSRVLPTHMGGA
jgi:hypothetical protein